MQSFCWWCGKKLQLPFYTVVTDHLGHQQKIHKCCKADAEKEIRPATAQPKPDNASLEGRAAFGASARSDCCASNCNYEERTDK